MLYQRAPGGTVENQGNLQDNRCRDRDSNQALPIYNSDSSDTRLYRIYLDRLFKAVMNKKLGDFENQRDISYSS
jgi:hypothetical protein